MRAISEALTTIDEIHSMADRVRAATAEPQADHVAAFIRALDYMLARPGRTTESDELYMPMVTWTNGHAYPERIGSADDATVRAWEDALWLFGTNAMVAARVGDLLWIKRAGERPDLYARQAQAAFRNLWDEEGVASVNRSDGLVRALQIASELRDHELVADTTADLVEAARQTMADEDWAPGAVYRCSNLSQPFRSIVGQRNLTS